METPWPRWMARDPWATPSCCCFRGVACRHLPVGMDEQDIRRKTQGGRFPRGLSEGVSPIKMVMAMLVPGWPPEWACACICMHIRIMHNHGYTCMRVKMRACACFPIKWRYLFVGCRRNGPINFPGGAPPPRTPRACAPRSTAYELVQKVENRLENELKRQKVEKIVPKTNRNDKKSKNRPKNKLKLHMGKQIVLPHNY